jgi:hypothetical protein
MYAERLRDLGLPMLAQRRVEADMVLTYKILGENSADYSEQWFTKMATQRPTRQSSGLNNLIEGRASHSYRRKFFSLRVPRAWNSLPDYVKEAGSASAFKARLRQNSGRVAQTYRAGAGVNQ